MSKGSIFLTVPSLIYKLFHNEDWTSMLLLGKTVFSILNMFLNDSKLKKYIGKCLKFASEKSFHIFRQRLYWRLKCEDDYL